MILLVHIFLSIFGVADVQCDVPFHPLIVDAYLVNDQGTADQVDDEHHRNWSVEPNEFSGLILKCNMYKYFTPCLICSKNWI